MFALNGTIILSQPMNDAFSQVQTLPFPWTFYGDTVLVYQASDNGYITFDTSTTTNSGSNGSLPSISEPNRAIYAFWDNLELSNNPSFITNDIKTYTVGSAPNRVHVIQWHVTPLGKAGNSHYLYFALRIYEEGNFDIIFQQIRLGSGSVSGTVGCENQDGNNVTMVQASPNFTYTGGAYIKENILVYHFIYGTQPQYDIEMKVLDIKEVVDTATSYFIKGKLVNHGSETIDSVAIEYQVENNQVQSAVLDGLNIATNREYDFTHPTKWTPMNVGNFESIKVWISKINGNNDMNPKDDTLTHSAFVNMGISATKKVFIEEFSTAPCSYCPEGHSVLREIMKDYPNVKGMIHYSGYQSDDMTISKSETIADEFAMGAPTACIDRILWQGNTKDAIDRFEWEDKALEALSSKAPVDIKISNSWDVGSRELDININLDFLDYPKPGDMRINVFIMEDSVTGIGSGYDQTNYFNSNVGHEFYNFGDPIVGYVHQHVIRAVLSNTCGESGIIPNNVGPDEQFLRNYKYSVPSEFKVKDISIIAFVSYYSNNPGDNREILNAEIDHDMTNGVNDQFNYLSNILSIYPNPFSKSAIIEFDNPGGERFDFKLFDLTGKIIREKVIWDNKFIFEKKKFLNGLYLVELNGPRILKGKVIVN